MFLKGLAKKFKECFTLRELRICLFLSTLDISYLSLIFIRGCPVDENGKINIVEALKCELCCKTDLDMKYELYQISRWMTSPKRRFIWNKNQVYANLKFTVLELNC